MEREEQIGEDLRQLEQRVDDLIGVCRRLKEENDNLRESRDTLIEEKSKLTEKNRMARTRLENIVTRLKALDKHQ
jgi:cell division protein ZapB